MSLIKGKNILLTGGSRGIGKSIVQVLIKNGANVGFTYSSSEDAANKISKKLNSDSTKCIAYKSDASLLEECEKLVESFLNDFETIDVLINNAGGAPMANALKASNKFHEAIIDLNLSAPLNVSQRFAKMMMKQKTVSNIINISSVTATRPTPGSAAYGAAKGGLVNLTKTLAVEWAPKIKVNSMKEACAKCFAVHLLIFEILQIT